jgi:glycosyltransferase involved in cell wall biosynthesis
MKAAACPGPRPRIAFFDYPDVFEDFYSHYGVRQHGFATRWAATANHAFLALIQREIGDVTWYVFSLAPQLADARHEVVGCRVKFFPSSHLHRWLWRLFYLSRWSWRWQRAYGAFATAASYLALFSWPFLRTLWRDRPDCIFVQEYATGRFDVLLLLARLLGVPLVARHAGSQPQNYRGGLLRRWTLRHADRIISSGRGESEMLTRRFRVPRECLTVILTPIELTSYRPLDRAAACQAAGLDPARRYLLFVGRLQDPVKRVSAILRAFTGLVARFPDADLLIVGEGPDGQKLRDLARALAPGRVRFPGWATGAEALAPLYNAAECLVLFSRQEGFPAVVGEAMACGTPVVSCRVGAVDELVIDGQTGWLTPPGDEAGLAGTLDFVLRHPEAAAAMRPQARRLAEARLSPDAVAAALRQCFRKGGRHG